MEDDEPLDTPLNQPGGGMGNLPNLPPGMFQPPPTGQGQGQGQQPVMTAPRPGMLPPPATGSRTRTGRRRCLRASGRRAGRN